MEVWAFNPKYLSEVIFFSMNAIIIFRYALSVEKKLVCQGLLSIPRTRHVYTIYSLTLNSSDSLDKLLLSMGVQAKTCMSIFRLHLFNLEKSMKEMEN